MVFQSHAMACCFCRSISKLFFHEGLSPNLVDSGGRRILADLGPDGAKALQIVMERDALSIKDAVTAALIAYARQAKLL